MPAAQAIRPARERLVREENRDLLGHAEQVRNEADTHRYLLIRRWMPGGTTLTLAMLNPSKATHLETDPTVTRCIGFARREGCNALAILNLHALRATDPAELYDHPDPVGERNDEFIDAHCLPGRLVVVAWGAHGQFRDRGAQVAARLITAGVDLQCFGRTKAGQPAHPLYLSASTPLIPYAP